MQSVNLSARSIRNFSTGEPYCPCNISIRVKGRRVDVVRPMKSFESATAYWAHRRSATGGILALATAAMADLGCIPREWILVRKTLKVTFDGSLFTPAVDNRVDDNGVVIDRHCCGKTIGAGKSFGHDVTSVVGYSTPSVAPTTSTSSRALKSPYTSAIPSFVVSIWPMVCGFGTKSTRPIIPPLSPLSPPQPRPSGHATIPPGSPGGHKGKKCEWSFKNLVDAPVFVLPARSCDRPREGSCKAKLVGFSPGVRVSTVHERSVMSGAAILVPVETRLASPGRNWQVYKLLPVSMMTLPIYPKPGLSYTSFGRDGCRCDGSPVTSNTWTGSYGRRPLRSCSRGIPGRSRRGRCQSSFTDITRSHHPECLDGCGKRGKRPGMYDRAREYQDPVERNEPCEAPRFSPRPAPQGLGIF